MLKDPLTQVVELKLMHFPPLIVLSQTYGSGWHWNIVATVNANELEIQNAITDQHCIRNDRVGKT